MATFKQAHECGAGDADGSALWSALPVPSQSYTAHEGSAQPWGAEETPWKCAVVCGAWCALYLQEELGHFTGE